VELDSRLEKLAAQVGGLADPDDVGDVVPAAFFDVQVEVGLAGGVHDEEAEVGGGDEGGFGGDGERARRGGAVVVVVVVVVVVCLVGVGSRSIDVAGLLGSEVILPAALPLRAGGGRVRPHHHRIRGARVNRSHGRSHRPSMT